MAVKRSRSRAAAIGAMLALVATTAANANENKVASDGSAIHGAIRDDLSTSLSQQADTVSSAQQMVSDKHALRHAELATRVRAAYKILRAGESPFWVQDADRSQFPVRLGAVRRVLTRDRAELSILDEELASLDAAKAANESQRVQLAKVELPPVASLARPVPGAIIRQLGTYRHDLSKATLSRRGLEFDAPAGQEVVAPIGGTVTFVGPVRDLDTVVVIRHQDTLVILGRLRAADVVKGEVLDARDLVGESAGRRLYCEVRLALGGAGMPVDPTPLFESR